MGQKTKQLREVWQHRRYRQHQVSLDADNTLAQVVNLIIYYGKPDGQKFVMGDRFISNDPRNCNLFINNIRIPDSVVRVPAVSLRDRVGQSILSYPSIGESCNWILRHGGGNQRLDFRHLVSFLQIIIILSILDFQVGPRMRNIEGRSIHPSFPYPP